MILHNFRGDLADISAKNEALLTTGSQIHLTVLNSHTVLSMTSYVRITLFAFKRSWSTHMDPRLYSRPVKFFPKLNNLFFGYFDPINIFFDNKNK